MTTTHFTHRGRKYRLATRAETPGAAWQLEYQERGKRIRCSMETPVKGLAVEKAKLVIEARQQGALEATRALLGGGRASSSTVAQVIDWAERTVLGCSERTRRGYLNCLRLVLRRTAGDGYASRPLVEVLTPGTIRAWTRLSQVRAASHADQEDANRELRSANSILRQAIALFAPRYVGHMRDAGLAVPDLTEFRAEAEVQRFRQVAKRDWHPPGEDVIARTLAAWRAAADTDRNLYVAIWLELSCGLRKGEIAQACWSWMREHELVGSASVKNRTGQVRVTPLEPYWTEGRAVAVEIMAGRYALTDGSMPEFAQHEFALVGSDTERTEGVFRRVSALLRDCGWKSHKTNHALRALAICWAVKERGIYAGSQFARHSSVGLTQKFYLWVTNEDPASMSPVAS